MDRESGATPGLENSIAGIGNFTGDDWERLTVGRQRIIALDAITMMRLAPQGRRVAFDATKSFARLLFTMADDGYVNEFGHIIDQYHEAIEKGDEPDSYIERLFDLANAEAANQGRLGKKSPPLSEHHPILTRNKT